ncbi:hypothetical protein [Paraburkholderia sp. GAS334]|uniref:hypothetical protein n=1 Tax=Paraburkholderia sp. GAS334 TaxID=3035131 RepID=UPI003D1EC30A
MENVYLNFRLKKGGLRRWREERISAMRLQLALFAFNLAQTMRRQHSVCQTGAEEPLQERSGDTVGKCIELDPEVGERAI